MNLTQAEEIIRAFYMRKEQYDVDTEQHQKNLACANTLSEKLQITETWSFTIHTWIQFLDRY